MGVLHQGTYFWLVPQQEAGRLQEPDLLLGLTQSQDNASFFLPGAPDCHAGGGRRWGGVSWWSPVLSRHIFSQMCPAPVEFRGDLSAELVCFKLRKHCEMGRMIFCFTDEKTKTNRVIYNNSSHNYNSVSQTLC